MSGILPATSVSLPVRDQQKAWSESAYDWLLRSEQLQVRSAQPHDPSSAAWSFARPSERNGTGISFVDAALSNYAINTLPVVEIRGYHRTGKTCTLLTLAARFVADTRQSRFPRSDESGAAENLPQVVILDSNQDVTAPRLLCAVRSALLRQFPEDDGLEKEMRLCLSRIHVILSDNLPGWVPLLESLRHRLSSVSSDHPTLVLWDGFLSDTGDSAAQMEVIRQLTRLLNSCSILLFTTTLPSRKFTVWEKHVSRRITIEYENQSPSGGHEYVAILQNSNRIPFTIASGGVMC